MGASFKYAFISLRNTKGLFISMAIMPIIMVLLVTITLAYSTTPMVGYLGNGAPLERIEGIRLQKLAKSDKNYFLGSNQGNLIVELDEQGNIKRYYSSVKNNPIIDTIEAQMKNPSDRPYREKPKIAYSIGIILGKLLTGAALLGTLLIQEKNSGILVRLKNGKVSFYQYVFGKALAVFLVYEIGNLILLTFFHFSGFDFGESTPLQLAVLLTISLLLSLGLYTFLSSITTNEGFLWLFSTGVVFPLSLCSGILFPIQFMPFWMKTIAHISPLYYLIQSFTEGTIMLMPILIMLVISGLLMIIGVENTLRRR